MIHDHRNIWLLRPGVGGFGDLPTRAIWLRAANELVMIFEDGLVAIVQSDRSFEVSRISFEVTWIELPDNSTARVVVGGY